MHKTVPILSLLARRTAAQCSSQLQLLVCRRYFSPPRSLSPLFLPNDPLLCALRFASPWPLVVAVEHRRSVRRYHRLLGRPKWYQDFVERFSNSFHERISSNTSSTTLLIPLSHQSFFLPSFNAFHCLFTSLPPVFKVVPAPYLILKLGLHQFKFIFFFSCLAKPYKRLTSRWEKLWSFSNFLVTNR